MGLAAGASSWLAIESVIEQRLYHAPAMDVALRPTLGIQVAPATVGAVAYLNVTKGPPDVVAPAKLLQAQLVPRAKPSAPRVPAAPDPQTRNPLVLP